MYLSARLTLLLFLLPLCCIAQQGSVISVEGRVYEQIEGRPRGIPGMQLYINHHGSETTDSEGRFHVYLPVSEEPIQIEVRQSDYNILTPPGGEIQLGGIFPATRPLRIDIIVQGPDTDPEYREKVTNLNAQVRALQREKRLTNRQIYDLRRVLVDTINRYEHQIADLEEQLDQATSYSEEQTRLNAENRRTIESLQGRIQSLLVELAAEKEKRYLRQQAVFEKVSAGLKAYRTRAADLKDQLPLLSSCFRDQAAFRNFSTAIDAYNKIYNEIEAGHPGWSSDVYNYWEAGPAARSLDDTFRYLLHDVHRESVLLVQQNVIPYFHENPPRPRKAQQEADAIYAQLAPRIEALEAKIDQIIEELRAQF